MFCLTSVIFYGEQSWNCELTTHRLGSSMKKASDSFRKHDLQHGKSRQRPHSPSFVTPGMPQIWHVWACSSSSSPSWCVVAECSTATSDIQSYNMLVWLYWGAVSNKFFIGMGIHFDVNFRFYTYITLLTGGFLDGVMMMIGLCITFPFALAAWCRWFILLWLCIFCACKISTLSFCHCANVDIVKTVQFTATEMIKKS